MSWRSHGPSSPQTCLPIVVAIRVGVDERKDGVVTSRGTVRGHSYPATHASCPVLSTRHSALGTHIVVLIGAGVDAIPSRTVMFFTMSPLSLAAMSLTIVAMSSGG